MAIKGVWEAVRLGDRKAIKGRIASHYLSLYETNANAFSRWMGNEGPKFKLSAAWKRREISRQSNVIATSLEHTMRLRRSSLDAKTAQQIGIAQAQRAAGKIAVSDGQIKAAAEAQWYNWVNYKQKQIEEILEARASLESRTDILVQSGISTTEDSVMYFGGSATCELCQAIAGNNPHTIDEARSLGGLAHPNCKDHWTDEADKRSPWETRRSLVDEARSKVMQGEAKLWNGSGRTPVKGAATEIDRELRQVKDPWTTIRKDFLGGGKDNAAN